MWKTLIRSERTLRRVNNLQKINRTFLSEAYQCSDAWNKRLESSLLSKINPEEMFHELDKKFHNNGKASAVDVDIYANVLKGVDHVDELIDVIYKLRLTPEATNILDSTHHAVIRYFFENNQINDLLTILHDRYNYGIFPDYQCYNMLMDAFVKKGDFASAAKVAVLLTLQEDSTNVISNNLALYSCHKYLEKPDDWRAPESEPVPEVKKRTEVIKVRVAFIRNPYFDDHFDLKNPDDLVGKTLVFYGKLMNDVTGRSCHLRGLALWEKYKEACDLIREWTKNGVEKHIYGEILTAVNERLSAIPEDKLNEDVKKLKELIKGFDKSSLKEGSILEDIENRLCEAVKAQEETDISEARENYEKWEQTRISLLEDQLKELDIKERLDKVDEMKEELTSRERLLTFFENRSKIELQIEEKLRMEKKMYGKYKPSSEDIEDSYVPPEIVKRRNK